MSASTNQIKSNRANDLTPFISSRVRKEIWQTIRESKTIVDRLTGEELAIVLKLLAIHWQKACEWKEKEIINEGCLWDSNKKKLIEFGD